MLAMVSAWVPVLVRVIDCGPLLLLTAWFPNPRLAGATLPPGAVAVPDSVTKCGLPGASSLIVTEADFVPANVGEKVMVTLQLRFTSSIAPQLCDLENCVASDPLRRMLAIVSG